VKSETSLVQINSSHQEKVETSVFFREHLPRLSTLTMKPGLLIGKDAFNRSLLPFDLSSIYSFHFSTNNSINETWRRGYLMYNWVSIPCIGIFVTKVPQPRHKIAVFNFADSNFYRFLQFARSRRLA